MKHHTLLAIAFVAVCSCCTGNAKSPFSSHSDTIPAEPVTHQVTLLFGGDLMQHEPQIKSAARPGGKYDYTGVFDQMKAEIESADLTIANFEVTLGGKPYTGYPQFRAPDEYLQAVVDAGFDVLLTANNHCVDSHRAGLERTILMMDSLHVPHLGTYVDQQSRDLTYPFLLERNGLRIALLNFTYGTNGLPVEHPNIVNLIDTLQLRADIAKARQMQPDAIIALPHWGIEYQQLPSAEQRSLAQWLIDNGVDHVIGGHPHVAQPLELSADSCHLIAWSMGNVISNQSRANTYGGYFVRLDITRRDTLTTTLTEGRQHADTLVTKGRARLADCAYTLYWVSRPSDSGNRHNYRILPIDEPDSVLTGLEQKNRYAIRSSMRRLMDRHAKGVREYPFK